MTATIRNPIYFLFLILTLINITFPVQANTADTSAIIDKVLSTYGGKALTDAKSLKLIDHNKGPWPGESENPGIPEIWRINEELVIDFEAKRKSLLSYRVPRTTLDLEKWIFDGDKGIKYDILHQKYSYEDWVTYNNLGGSLVRSSDTMHARQLHTDSKEITYLKDEYYRGKVHHLLTVTLNSGSTFTYYIEQQSGLIQKVIRHNPRVKMAYIFSNHQITEGITYASDMNFFVNGELRLTSVLRGVELNPDLREAFSHFDSFTHWGETIDNSEMAAKKLSKGVYQAGKRRSLTVFVEQSDHFIAIGGADSIKVNFQEVKKLTNSNKPIGYFVVTHHHRSNLNGLNNVLGLGAKLVIAKAHQTAILNGLAQSYSNNDLVVVRDRKAFMLGNLTLYDIPTAHSQHYLLAYSADNKMVIAEEHYETELKTAKPRIYKDMVLFGNVLKSLNIDVKTLIDVRSWRQFGIEEFMQWINNFSEKSCPTNYEICAGG